MLGDVGIGGLSAPDYPIIPLPPAISYASSAEPHLQKAPLDKKV